MNMVRKDSEKARTDVLKSLITVLLTCAVVFFFILPPTCAAPGAAGTEQEDQSEGDEDEGTPWAFAIVGILAGAVVVLLAWFLFNPLPPKGISKRAQGEISLYECWVSPSEPVVGKETELKVILENAGPARPPGEHDVGVDIYEEFEVIEKIEAGSFSLETGTTTELPVSWVPEMNGERKITVIITQGGAEVDMYSFSKTVEEE